MPSFPSSAPEYGVAPSYTTVILCIYNKNGRYFFIYYFFHKAYSNIIRKRLA